MSESTYTPQAELLDPDMFPSYLVRDPRSIVQILRQMADKRALFSVIIRSPQQSFVSTILEVDADAQAALLDVSPDTSLTQRVLDAPSITCLTRLDGIRIQFDLQLATKTTFEGAPALRFALPDQILRLQRRESYRLPVPINNPSICRISFPLPEGQTQTEELRVLDLSNDGLALLLTKDLAQQLGFHANQVLDKCELLLPEFPPMPVVLRIRNQFDIQTANGVRNQRLGCAFVDLANKASTNIQRYIFKIERERRAMFNP